MTLESVGWACTSDVAALAGRSCPVSGTVPRRAFGSPGSQEAI
jgi:hypothetical protein